MVFCSKGNISSLSIKSLETTLFCFVFQAQCVAFPSGGAPSEVGKYFGTSGSSNGRLFSGTSLGRPATKYTGIGSPQ